MLEVRQDYAETVYRLVFPTVCLDSTGRWWGGVTPGGSVGVGITPHRGASLTSLSCAL